MVMPTRELEQTLWARGHDLVAGIDEVGRGPLAGPVTVAAVVLKRDSYLPDVRDSKRLSPKRRIWLAGNIRREAIAIGIGWASHHEIDAIGLTAALRLAGRRALLELPPVSAVILDGKHNYLGDEWPVVTAVQADQHCMAVASASIVAKVARDNYMELLDGLHPEYGFARHKGYGAVAHMTQLERLGPCSYHRQTWGPVRTWAHAGS